MITFYDIPSTLPSNALSGNTWKTRFTLNYKGIPYKTEWVELPDIEPLCQKLSIPATGKKADGSPSYTLPAIHDPSTGANIADSFLIAQYLDKTYPDTPCVIPAGTETLQDAFISAFLGAISTSFPITVLPFLNPPSAEYYRQTKSKKFVRPSDETMLTGASSTDVWEKMKAEINKVDQWMQRSGGPFVMGKDISFADFVIGATLKMMALILGEESVEWDNVIKWNNGRWKSLFQSLEKYSAVV